MNRLKNTLAVVGAAAAMTGAIEASSANAAPVHKGPNVPVKIDTDPEAHTASADTDWTVYGGNPLFEGGVHSDAELHSDLESATGQTALRILGFNPNEISLLVKDADKAPTKHFPFGFCYKAMVSGGFAQDPEGACFEDRSDPNGFDALVDSYSVTSTKKMKEDIKGREATVTVTTTDKGEVDFPTNCGNASLANHSITSHQSVSYTPIPKPSPVPKKEVVEVYKIALDDNGNVLPATPTNTFHFKETVTYKGKTTSENVTYNHSPQVLGKAPVGAKVSITEEATTGNEKWESLTTKIGVAQKFRVGHNIVKAVFKDEEVKPAQPAPAPEINCSGNTTNTSTSSISAEGGNCSTNTVTVIVVPPKTVTPPAGPTGPTGPTSPPTPTIEESISISPLTTAEPLFPNSKEQLCVDAEYSPANGGTPEVTFAVTSGEGKIVGATYQDSDGNPDHQCAEFDNGADVGESKVTATATGDGATASTQFSITTQQDSGF